MSYAQAVAHNNIALIKYWGKLAAKDNIPAVGSLSVTLGAFYTRTRVRLDTTLKSDRFVLNGTQMGGEKLERVTLFLDDIRRSLHSTCYCDVVSDNFVPTAAGLASSASGFAALALAASSAYGLSLDAAQLSRLARRGSGSAARSIYPNFACIPQGPLTDETAIAHPIAHASSLDLIAFVVMCDAAEKSMGSRATMQQAKAESVFYEAFLKTHPQDLSEGISAVKTGDFERLAMLSESSALKMHATLFGLPLPLWYFSPLSFEAMNLVRSLRSKGHACFFTLDAGPNVKIFAQKCEQERLGSLLTSAFGAERVLVSGMGPGAYLECP